NLISGNAFAGISIGEGFDLTPQGAKCNVIQGNTIGTDRTGTLVLGNGIGVIVNAHGNTVGGTQPGTANLIMGNTLAGVEIENGIGNAILGNSIYANGSGGIQLDPQYSPNGGNDNQAAPVLTSATLSGGGTTISGTLASAAKTPFRIEFYSNLAPGPF